MAFVIWVMGFIGLSFWRPEQGPEVWQAVLLVFSLVWALFCDFNQWNK